MIETGEERVKQGNVQACPRRRLRDADGAQFTFTNSDLKAVLENVAYIIQERWNGIAH